MPMFFCHTCGRLVDTSKRVSHKRFHDDRKQWSPNRDQAAHARFRSAALATYGARCEVCGTDRELQVHHRNGDVTDNRPENGQVLCRAHHREVDAHAR